MRFPVTIAVSILGIVCPTFSQQSEDLPDPVLVSLRTRLERELGGLEPAPSFETPTGYAGKQIYGALSFRGWTDKKLIEKIRKILESVGSRN